MTKGPEILNRLILLLITLVLSACSSVSIDDQQPKDVSYHYGYQDESPLADFFQQTTNYDPSLTGFFPLNKGEDALLTRLALIEGAKKSLDVQYYIYRDDETSLLMTWRLYEAAQRGVRVRLLLDDMQKRDDLGLATLNAHPNIEVRLFNPHQYRQARMVAFASDFSRLNRRMHNKSLTADNVATIIGGRNIGNEYFSFGSNVEFGDFDVLLYGDTVEQTAVQFDTYWNSVYAIPMEWIVSTAPALNDSEIQQFISDSGLEAQFTSGQYNLANLELYQQFQRSELTLYWGKGKLWYDMPDKVTSSESLLIDNLVELLSRVEDSMVLISPYFVPTESGTREMVKAAQDGINITIITNSLASNDVFAVHGWYAKYRADLVEGGIELWEFKPTVEMNTQWSMTGSSRSSLHAKAIMFDQRKLFVGSMNWDPRSAYLNTEMAVVLEHPNYVQSQLDELSAALPQIAYKVVVEEGKVRWLDLDSGERYTSEPKASIWRKMGAWFSGLLPIEDQL
ncbi:phospholipase D family protein [Vibrio hangzhouensis]|uniref:Phosphatidylserine/phosphatidylglycerophosphate/cardiolipin synthase n=1 Tax=Vibrio hangzhouensis TaxID=462991 RepID=A0A1H5X0T1_9VIBR|nr:phospholipase D family protein [Vibrio hangzhouensis]SEG04897.1 Phosphatidylserine/phosphatidylglycerophosphate/cardiolipin synthase [Vibrio hangzhouensis]